MKSRLAIALTLLWAASAAADALEDSAWAGYLDYAYVYTSAEPTALRARLDQYGHDAGMRFEEYLARITAAQDGLDETGIRRAAIAHLIHYLATGEPDSLDAAVDQIRRLEDRLSRHENRYWYNYILAHRALEKGQPYDFVGELLDLWLGVVVPLETPYETLQTLSLGDSPNSGFVSALPYVYENVARLILIRSQRMGLDRDLDPLGAIVRMLADGRVGANPDVIPVELSSRDYLERIVSRLDGPESDAGSLTFTLALFEASRYHDEARALLASQGFSSDALKALRVASGAYEAALDRASTLQGQCAVYTRVLRELGEIYAAKQRLGADPDFETPFTIDGAIEVYSELQHAAKKGDLDELGYRTHEDWIGAMHGLWEEIQETSLNAADYYLARASKKPELAAEDSRNAARVYARYLSFFDRFANSDGREAVPDSAYFAAYEAARGYGDAMLFYAPGNVSPAELELATRRYLGALQLFPFEPRVWTSLTAALERQGRESEYLELVRPVAEAVTRSRHVDQWIEHGEPGAKRIATIRRALADSQVLVYLGFAEESGIDKLESSIGELKARRDEVEARLVELARQHGAPGPASRGDVSAGADGDGAPAAKDDLSVEAVERAEQAQQIADARALLDRLERQIAARTRALPIYKAALAQDGLADELRARRDHPVHTLLRRMYDENRS
jgi:hypothetical protein